MIHPDFRVTVVDLHDPRPSDVSVAVIQIETFVERYEDSHDLLSHRQPEDDWKRLLRLIKRANARLPNGIPKLFVLPELSIASKMLPRLRQWASRTKATVVGGTDYYETATGRVSKCPIIVGGHTYWTAKSVPSPFERSAVDGRSLQPGTLITSLQGSPVGNLAVAICSDFLSDEFLASVTKACPNLDFLCIIACQRETTRYSERMSQFVSQSSAGTYALYANLDFGAYGDGHSAIYGAIDHHYHDGLRKAGYSDLMPTNKVAELRHGDGFLAAKCSLNQKKPVVPRSVQSTPNITVLTVNPPATQKLLFPPSNAIEFVFFDLDGTLLRFQDGHRYSWPLVFQELGIDDSVRKQLMRAYLHEKIAYDEWCMRVGELFRSKGLTRFALTEVAKKARLVQNFHSALAKLRQNRIGVGLISGGIDTLLFDILRHQQDYFLGRRRF